MKKLWMEYLLVWAVAAVLWLTLPRGGLVAYPVLAYGAEYACVGLTLLSIYLGLKMFAGAPVRNRVRRGGESTFRRLWEIRLWLLAIVLFADLGVYAATLNTIGGFCALITAFALFFVTPSLREQQDLCQPEETNE